MLKEIKKQIDSQTREKVGNIKIESEGTRFVETPVSDWAIGRTGEKPIVTWSKTSYMFNRGLFFNLTPNIFNYPMAQKSSQDIATKSGNFIDTAPSDYYNARYSGWAGIKGGGSITITLRTGGSSASVWVDDQQVFVSSFLEFNETNVTINIGTKSLIQVFWYTRGTGNTISITGSIADHLSYWETVDSSPFADTVEWYTDDPITSDSISTFSSYPQEYIKLRWWFGNSVSEESEELPGGIEEVQENIFSISGSDQDIGGFGIWSIDFQDIGEIDVLDSDTISIYGYYPNIRYLRIGGVVYLIDYVESFNSSTNRSNVVIEGHGLTDADDGTPVDGGIIKHIKDIPMSVFTSSASDVYETTDMDIVRGTRYYYLVDTYDTSPNKNRGGITETYQTIIAGDFTAPDIVKNLSAERNSYDSVTISWSHDNPIEIKQYNVYSDVYSDEYNIVEGGIDLCILSSGLNDMLQMMAMYPGGFLVSLEVVTGEKYVRRITSVVGSVLTFDRDLPEGVTSGDTLRIVSVVNVMSNSLTGIPTPPLVEPVPIELDINPL